MSMFGAVLMTLTPMGQTTFLDAAATTSVSNPSLESDADSDRVPDCWQPQSDGKSRDTFTWSTSVHSGTHAEQLTITQYRSGIHGLFIQMGSSGCGPAVTAGHSYTLSAWYRTGGQARVTSFYRDASGTWVPWTSGPALAAASSWTRADYVTPAIPADATGLSFGIELRSKGTLTTDDYSISDAGSTTTSATTSPTATATSSPTATATSSPTATATPSPTATATSSPTTSPTTSSPSPTATSSTTSATSSAPPPASGYFTNLVAPGNVSALPGDGACAAAVKRSTWEPRPDNYKPNHTLVDAAAVHNSFAQRSRTAGDPWDYDARWDSWLLPRVDGQFTGTTDEIIQWAACKWGLPDNYLRAEADIESTWFQYETYPSGRCVDTYGCGDWFGSEPYTARKTYCDGLASSGGYDYQKDYGDGLCPETFSIVGVMSWWNPSWGYSWAGNQDGTFPFTRDATAMALDYMASQIRGCYEGWEWELGTGYSAGDLWGCAGAWYSGGWHDSRAETYISHVQAAESTKPWLASTYASEKPSCDPTFGCPGPSTLQ